MNESELEMSELELINDNNNEIQLSYLFLTNFLEVEYLNNKITNKLYSKLLDCVDSIMFQDGECIGEFDETGTDESNK